MDFWEGQQVARLINTGEKQHAIHRTSRLRMKQLERALMPLKICPRCKQRVLDPRNYGESARRNGRRMKRQMMQNVFGRQHRPAFTWPLNRLVIDPDQRQSEIVVYFSVHFDLIPNSLKSDEHFSTSAFARAKWYGYSS